MLKKNLDTFIDYRYSLPLVCDDIDDTSIGIMIFSEED